MTILFASGALLLAACAADDPLEAGAPNDADHVDDTDHVDDADHDDSADHDGTEVDLVIDLEMTEFAFNPDPIEVPAGSTVRFVFTNNGGIEHEAVIGDMDVQHQAEATMAAEAGHDEAGHGDEAPSIVLEPGMTGELVVTFDGDAEVIIGCHIPGHWDAGMHADLTVA